MTQEEVRNPIVDLSEKNVSCGNLRGLRLMGSEKDLSPDFFQNFRSETGALTELPIPRPFKARPWAWNWVTCHQQTPKLPVVFLNFIQRLADMYLVNKFRRVTWI